MESWRELVASFSLFLRSAPFAISGHRVPPRCASRLPKLLLDRQLFWRAGKCRGIRRAPRPISLRFVGAAFPQPRFSPFSPSQPRRQTTEQQREDGGGFETAVRLLFFRQIEHVRPRLFGDLVASERVQRSSHDRRMEVGNLWDFRRDISRQGDLRSTGGPI